MPAIPVAHRHALGRFPQPTPPSSQQQVDDLRAKAAEIALGGDAKSRERHAARGKLLAARARRRPARPGLALPRDRPARRLRHVRAARRRRAGMIAGIGRVAGQRMHGRRQRRDGEGRHLLPDDGEEAPARAGDRAAEPPALHLPRRFRRRLPAAARTRSSRPRALRPDLLQPGQHERARASPRSRW